MFAIIEDRGFQRRVAEGDVVAVNSMSAEVGSQVVWGEVLAVGDENGVRFGTPHVPGAAVKAEVIRHGLGPKVSVFRFKRRKNYRRKKGHRQPLTWLKVVAVESK